MLNKTMWKNLAYALPLLLAATACGNRADKFTSVLPRRDQVKMNVPANNDALAAGDQSELYLATLGISTSVNGGVLWAFDVIEAILAMPPTTLDEDQAVWGPSEPKGLERLSYRFTVNRIEEGHFSYKLEARLKENTEESDFVIVFDGEALPGDDDRGTGTLNYHLGSRRNLMISQCDLIGEIHVQYDTTTEPRMLDVVLNGVADECKGEDPTDAHYIYTESPDASGTMDFAVRNNMHRPDENKPLEEVLAVRSRWLGTGQGRSDVQVSEGEIPTDLATYIPGTTATSVEIVECWSDVFVVDFTDTTPDELEPHLGHAQSGDASLCAFPDAEFASL